MANERHPSFPLQPLPTHPEGLDWPTAAWPRGEVGPEVDRTRLDVLIERAFSDPAPESMSETHALLIVQRGRIVQETYWRDHAPDDTYPSWSMAKSITHALVGILVRDGKLDIHRPAPVPEWQGAGDPTVGRCRLDTGVTHRENTHVGSCAGSAFLGARGDLPVEGHADILRPCSHDRVGCCHAAAQAEQRGCRQPHHRDSQISSSQCPSPLSSNVIERLFSIGLHAAPDPFAIPFCEQGQKTALRTIGQGIPDFMERIVECSFDAGITARAMCTSMGPDRLTVKDSVVGGTDRTQCDTKRLLHFHLPGDDDQALDQADRDFLSV